MKRMRKSGRKSFEGSPARADWLTSMKKILSIAIMLVVFATAALAQDRAIERDPFHPTEKRAAAPAPVPADNAWGRDPFNNPLAGRTLVRTERGSEVQGKGLTGIIYGENIRLAIFNGETVREGGSIGDKKVESINERSVKLTSASGGVEEVFLRNFSMRK